MHPILLVEDEPLLADLIVEVFDDRGLAVVHAASALAARSLLEERRDFAAVVTDINLGDGVSGFDVAREARALNPGLKIVYMSGLPSNFARAEPDALIFPKPFPVGDMVEQVALLLGGN